MGQKRGERTLAANIAGAIVLALSVNAIIFALGWQRTSGALQPTASFFGPIAGTVWAVLFGLMGAARYRLGERHAFRLQRRTTQLIVLCAAYPFYALATDNPWVGFVGTVITLAFAFSLLRSSRRRAAKIAALITPVVMWLAYLLVVSGQVMKLN